MKTYQVEWTVTIDADSEHEAAQQALAMQRDPESIATVFHVRDFNVPSDDYTVIDLDAAEDSACPACGADNGTTCGAVNCAY